MLGFIEYFIRRNWKPLMVLALTMTILGMFMSKVFIPNHMRAKDRLIQQLAQKRSSTIVIELTNKKT